MAKKKKTSPKAIDARLRSRVKVFSSKDSFENIDVRRKITGVVGNFHFPFPLRQIKLIEFSREAVRNNLVVGNHGHPKNSGQWEIIIVLGPATTPMFRFRHKGIKSKISERILYGGDVAVIPPGCILAFVPLQEGARLLEISNKEYKPNNYIEENLFEV